MVSSLRVQSRGFRGRRGSWEPQVRLTENEVNGKRAGSGSPTPDPIRATSVLGNFT